MEFNHKSVMPQEVIGALSPSKDKIFFDGTAGGGGHTQLLAEKAKAVIAVDKDPDAISNLKEKFADRKNVHIVNDDFVNIKEILSSLAIDSVNGVLLDLGVSSFQLDSAERGFSYHTDMPLDMRMSKTGLSAYDVVNTYTEQQLSEIIWKYGEEKYSRSIAKNIVKARETAPVKTTFELVNIIKGSVPASEMRKKHPARKTFQAIRIEVNSELETLKAALDNCFESLAPGGVLAVITFHSLEDRMVKEKLADWARGCICPKEFPVCVCNNKPKGKPLFKFKKPLEKEIEMNPRSRSATLRAFQKY
ncbi:MAG: 16S rRNA (cytosine(1402)-N(4))-methyltransferase RsmH [Clostridiales bacterium]|nr:16S rRNA (cytosine(1402)-N(4))-methyltransferase RsmH [Clostridiales bacterium]